MPQYNYKYNWKMIFMSNKMEQLTQILKKSNNIVFFGGAGVNT